MSMILLVPLIAEVKGTFYTNKLTAETLVFNGNKYTCFDKYNGSILDSRLSIFHTVFFPVTNCMFSNMFSNINVQQSYILDLEQDVKRNKFWKYPAIGGFIYLAYRIGRFIIESKQSE